jgi:hypothetical protein
MSDHEVGAKLLEDYVFIHLSGARDKLNLLLQMVHKLYALVGYGRGAVLYTDRLPG